MSQTYIRSQLTSETTRGGRGRALDFGSAILAAGNRFVYPVCGSRGPGGGCGGPGGEPGGSRDPGHIGRDPVGKGVNMVLVVHDGFGLQRTVHTTDVTCHLDS